MRRYPLNLIDAANGDRLHPKPGWINRGGNSGFHVPQKAFWRGGVRLLLLGYDMGRTGGKSHWHGDHPNGLGNNGAYAKWIVRFGYLADDLKKRGVEVINCSRMSALTCFPRKAIEEVI